MIRLVLATLAAAALSACASMNVNVSVLNPSAIESHVDRYLLHNVLPAVAAVSEADLSSNFGAMNNAHHAVYSRTQRLFRAECKMPNRTEALQRYCDAGLDLEANYASFWDPEYDRVTKTAAERRANVADLNAAWVAAGSDTKPQKQADLVEALREYQHVLQNFGIRVEGDIGLIGRKNPDLSQSQSTISGLVDRLNSDSNAAAISAITQSRKDVEKKLTELLAQQRLDADPYAYAVASAEDNHWANHYNVTHALGVFGSTDIAIRMNSLSNYTIKGLAFDPSDVAQMASKVIAQSVILAAQIEGVPISTSNPTGDGAALAKSSVDISTLQEKLLTQQAEIQDQREALLNIAAAIVRERDHVRGDATQRKDAITAIRAVFTAQSTRLTKGG